MKARIIRSNIEVDVQPHYQEGWFVGFTETANPGLILYRPQDLIFPDTYEWDHTDWSYFRREAAKDILASISKTFISIEDAYLQKGVALSVKLADELIKKLKEQ